jgi:hypothetical protein
VGSYANPCYIAAYELCFCLDWEPAETTLISLGTGRDPHTLESGDADRFRAWNWLGPILGAFLQSADDQQVHLVRTFFEQLDFRRFQVDFSEPIKSDDPSKARFLMMISTGHWRLRQNALYVHSKMLKITKIKR